LTEARAKNEDESRIKELEAKFKKEKKEAEDALVKAKKEREEAEEAKANA